MSLQLLDLTLGTPEENLALDEALLLSVKDAAARAEEVGYLRFWESDRHFVVLGVSCRLLDDADVERCRQDDVPILRRASGGGTVLQGPGCLNFTLALPLAGHPELEEVPSSYAAIVGRTARALAEGAGLRGSSDLALGDRKFGGSSQKRTRGALLHQGSILHAFQLDLIQQYLREPKKQPQYRRGRSHLEFLTNLSLSPEAIKTRVAKEWRAGPVAGGVPLPPLEPLLEEKYSRREWTERF